MVTFQSLMAIAYLIFLVALAWYFQLLANPEYNKLAGVFVVFLVIWFFSVAFRFVFNDTDLISNIETSGGNELLYTPEWSKCLFGQNECNKAKFTWWTILHILMFTIIGYIVPGLYLEILIISIAFEIIEHGVGYPGKFVLDPIANLIGYTIGSAISKNSRNQ